MVGGIIGGLVAVFALFAIPDQFYNALIGLLFFTVILAGSVVSFRRVKPTFHVTVTSSSGEIRALSSFDRPYIEKIVGAINEAIFRYR
jgi:hypothetical protein